MWKKLAFIVGDASKQDGKYRKSLFRGGEGQSTQWKEGMCPVFGMLNRRYPWNIQVEMPNWKFWERS